MCTLLEELEEYDSSDEDETANKKQEAETHRKVNVYVYLCNVYDID